MGDFYRAEIPRRTKSTSQRTRREGRGDGEFSVVQFSDSACRTGPGGLGRWACGLEKRQVFTEGREGREGEGAKAG